MPSIQFLKVVHAREQETAQNISIKYASRLPCDVWNNPCSFTETLQYETPIRSIIIFYFSICTWTCFLQNHWQEMVLFTKVSRISWYEPARTLHKHYFLPCDFSNRYENAIPDVRKDKLKMFMYADDVPVLRSKNTLLLFAFLKPLSCTNASDKRDLWSVCLATVHKSKQNATRSGAHSLLKPIGHWTWPLSVKAQVWAFRLLWNGTRNPFA